MRPLLFSLLLLSGPALAQSWEPVWQVRADLDGNGRPEAYYLSNNGAGGVDLTVEAKGWERTAPSVAWLGGPGQKPELSISPAGSVVLSSMNEAMGRDRWRLDVTIAHRGGDWRVAGITYEWRDTLDPAAWGRCDINLLSGRGVVETEAGPREIAAPFPAPALWDWSDSFDAYGVCGG